MSDYDKEYTAVYNLFREMYSEDDAKKRAQWWMTEQKYAWYSQKMHKCNKDNVEMGSPYPKYNRGKGEYKPRDFDCHIYLNLNGERIICTEVNNSPTKIDSSYDDFICLGKVIKWLGNSIEPIQNYRAAGSGIKAVNTLKKMSSYVYNSKED